MPGIHALTCIERAYRVRLRLKPTRERQLLRLFGARRYVWNWALRRKDEAWRADGTKLNAVSLSREFTQLKAAPAWLAELPREPFNQTLRDSTRGGRTSSPAASSGPAAHHSTAPGWSGADGGGVRLR